MRYIIVDDDTASRRMLANIIIKSELGEVIGEAESGEQAIPLVLAIRPEVVLIDLLMPKLDGIETMEQLQRQGFQGQFIMISQVVNKEMVGEAYEKGVEYFIHKPINRVEVQSILKKTTEQFHLKHSLITIRESLAHIESANITLKKRSVKETVLQILNDLGISSEAGSEDIVLMIEHLMNETDSPFPSLKDLYEVVAISNHATDIKKESKSIEQRIRRTIMAAINNIAAIGTIDYTNPKFEYYAPRFFDFQEIRQRMKEIENDSNQTKVKINIKKFLQVLHLETAEKYHQF
ncbi:response regulator [bacterium LRH843]|nr:response regulator [bacterium LRH843]